MRFVRQRTGQDFYVNLSFNTACCLLIKTNAFPFSFSFSFFFFFIMKASIIIASLVCLFTTTVNAKALDLSDYNLCQIQGDSSDCAFACQEMVQGRGACIFNKCYCTEKSEIGKCDDDDHESCDALCQDMSSTLIGFCMDGQCSCIS